MTEQQWQSCNDPAMMLTQRLLPIYPTKQHKNGMRSDRKLRLWAAACCRQIWSRLSTDARKAVRIAERYADGGESEIQVRIAYWRCSVGEEQQLIDNPFPGWLLVNRACCNDMDGLGERVQETYTSLPGITQAKLLRDIFGNTFRPSSFDICLEQHEGHKGECPTFRQTMTTWNDGTIPRIARRIYEKHVYQDMPVLADALEEAGCDDQFILRHCRGYDQCLHVDERPREEMILEYFPEHCPCCKGTSWRPRTLSCVRGCWVLDLILGKE